MPRTVTVIGGHGAVGSLLTRVHRGRGDRVVVVDLAPGPSVSVPADVTSAITPELEDALRTSDIVVLALPADIAAKALGAVTAALSPTALLVETLSVKSDIAEHLAAVDFTGPALGINPMFAPTLDMTGRVVAAVVHRDGGPARDYLALLTEAGVRTVTTTAAEHDRTVAVTQALTHASVLAFGLAATSLDVDPQLAAALAPPPFAALSALLARIASGTPEVYHDVQHGNPFASAARSALTTATTDVDAAVRSEADFASIMARALLSLGDTADDRRRVCAELFASPILADALQTTAEKGASR